MKTTEKVSYALLAGFTAAATIAAAVNTKFAPVALLFGVAAFITTAISREENPAPRKNILERFLRSTPTRLLSIPVIGATVLLAKAPGAWPIVALVGLTSIPPSISATIKRPETPPSAATRSSAPRQG